MLFIEKGSFPAKFKMNIKNNKLTSAKCLSLTPMFFYMEVLKLVRCSLFREKLSTIANQIPCSRPNIGNIICTLTYPAPYNTPSVYHLSTTLSFRSSLLNTSILLYKNYRM